MAKTILFATPKMIVGGAETYILGKAKYLKSRGYNIYILSEGGIWEERANDIANGHINISWINENPDYLTTKELLDRLIILSNIIDKYKIDLIEVNQLFPAIYFNYVEKIKKNKLIINVLSEISFIDNKYINLLKEYNEKSTYFNISQACNMEIEKYSKCILDKCKAINIPFKNEYKIKSTKYRNKYILTVARLEKEKMYIKNLAIDFTELCLKQNLSNIELIIVGDGSYRNEVERLVYQMNKKLKDTDCIIKMKGTVQGEELQQLFHDCYIYVGIGTTLINAAYYKKPAIIATYYPNDISKAYGYFNLYEDNVSIGQVIPGMVKVEYKKLIYDLLNDENHYNIIAKKGYDVYKKEFSEEVIMSKWENIYNDIISNNNIIIENETFKIHRNFKCKIKKIISIVKNLNYIFIDK